MALKDISAEAVLKAVAEWDAIGEGVFLQRYGFKGAKKYWVVVGGKRYPSKAIAGVAHKYVDGEPLLGSKDFTGGEGTVVRKLRQLGFEIEVGGRNPPWTRDEIVLALAFYRMVGGKVPAKDSPAILELSELLTRLHTALGTQGLDTIRNANGVYLKLMNLRALDPSYTSQGKVGMTSGGQLEKLLWTEFDGRPSDLNDEARRIREAISSIADGFDDGVPQGDDAEAEGEEGGVVMRLHKRRERDRKLVQKKRAWARQNGCLSCEVCDFDFDAAYGDLAGGYIEVHHVTPLHTLKPGSKTKLSDLALLCANCHRMAHRRRTPLTLEELRQARAAATNSLVVAVGNSV